METPYQSYQPGKRKVGYLGPGTGSFGYTAARSLFPEGDVDLVPLDQHERICRAVSSGELDQGVVAIENGIAGMVDESARAVAKAVMRREGIFIQAEVSVPVELYLMARHADPDRIECVASHDAALRQCGDFLEQHYPRLRLQRVNSTSAAAVLAAQSDGVAAIAGLTAQVEHKLVRLHGQAIQDKPGNQTRFWMIGQWPHEIAKTTHRKTAMLLANLDRDAAGSLKSALNCFSSHGCGLSVIYPIPHPQSMWEYSFLAEFESRDETAIDQAIQEYLARKLGDPPILLGTYENRTTAARLATLQSTFA